MKQYRKQICKSDLRRRWLQCWVVWLALSAILWPVKARAEEAPRQVLLLYSLGREFSPFNIMAGTFRTELAGRSPVPIEFHEAALETARSTHAANEEALVDYLQAMFSTRRLDLIVTLGGPATLFADRHRNRLFPQVAMIATIDVRRFGELSSPTNQALVPLQLNPRGLIEDILQVLPATTNIMVVLGTAPLSRYWTEQCKHEFAPFTNRTGFTYFTDLSLQQMRQKVQASPPNSAILFGGLVMDAAGIPHEQDEALTALYQVANAPMFGVYAHQLGLGIVGGRLTSNEAWGRRVAEAALRVLNGEPPGSFISQPTGPGAPVYDWRELKRWGIGRKRLPHGAEIRFREPTQWEQHKWVFLGGIALCLFEGALIARLILELRRRLRAENAARESELAAHEVSGRLIHTQEEERSRIARDLHDDFNQRLALLSVEIDLLGRKASEPDSAAKLKQLGGQVRELASDVHQLAYRLHPAKLDQLGLLPAVDGLCRDLSQQSGLEIHFSHHDIPKDLPPDAARCIYHVVQECLHNSVRHSGANEAHVELTAQNGQVRLSVSDTGKGFDVQSTRKAAGLGLLSMRERVKLSRGRLEIHSAPDRGTSVQLTIPWTKEETRA